MWSVCGSISALVLPTTLLLLAARRHLPRRRWPLACALLLVVGLTPVAASAVGPLPFVFSNGTVADATQVNANLNLLHDGITALEGQLATAQTRVRHLSIPPTALVPNLGGAGDNWNRGNASLELKPQITAATDTFAAPVNLPDGAVIQGVTAWVRDIDTTSATSITVQLLSGDNATAGVLGAVFPAMTSDSIDPTPGALAPLSQTGTYTVDNSARSLRVGVTITGTPSTVAFGNIVIDYTLPAL
jgi:hypothetical protein